MKISVFMLLFTILLRLDLLGAASNEDAIIKQIEDLRIESRRNISSYQQKLQELMKTTNPKATPRAWIRAYQLAADVVEPMPASELENLQRDAERHKDRDTLMYIRWIQVEDLKSKGADAKTILNKFAEARTFVCGEDFDPAWCGRVWRESAQYQYLIGDVVGGIDSIQNAIRILQNVADPFHYYVARQTYGLLLSHNYQIDESIQTEKENFEWFEKQDYWAEAAVAAYNVASAMNALKPIPKDEVFAYAKRAAVLAQKAEDSFSIALAEYLLGNTYLKTEDFSAALPHYRSAYQQFQEQGNTSFMVRALIQRSRALAALEKTKEAEDTLAQINQLQKIEHPMELMPILKVRESLALQRGDFPSAHASLLQYQELFEKRKEQEERNGLQRMSTQLGLVLEKERNLELSHKVEQAERLKIFLIILSLLTLSTLGFAGTTLFQKHRAHIIQAKLQQVLDHVDLGLLTFDQKLAIDQNHSAHLLDVMGVKGTLEGQNFVTTILERSHLSSEFCSMAQEILHAVFDEGTLAWELNADNLPRELTIERDRQHIHSLRWIPIFNPTGILKKVLLIMTDITHERELSQALGDQQKLMQALPDVLREILSMPSHRLLAFLDDVENVLKLDDPKRPLHTQKGVARSYGLFTMSHVLHNWESDLGDSKHRDEVSRQLNIHRTIASTLARSAAKEEHPQSLFQIVDPFLHSWVERLRVADLSLADLHLGDGVLDWQETDLILLRDCVIHGVNNSLDHGFIFPKQRGESVNPPRLVIRAQKIGKTLRMEISDNGAGIQVDKLAAVARAKGFVPKAGESLLDLLFWDGVSTADALTITSGRGVGLAALKTDIQSRGGTIGIRNQEGGPGTLLWAEWTLNKPL